MGRRERRASERRSQKQANATGRPVRSAVTGEVFGPARGRRIRPGVAGAPPGAATGELGDDGPAERPPSGGSEPAVVAEGSVAGPLGRLRASRRRRAALDRSDAEDVAAARAAGASWRDVGAALGVSHVTAIKRYGQAAGVNPEERSVG